MKLVACTMITLCLFAQSALAEQEIKIEKVFTTEVKTDEEVAKLVVELVKTTALRTQYEKHMEEAYDFIDAEWRADITSADSLETLALSQWTPSSSFRIGQGDYEFCDMEKEYASYNYQTKLIGFETSYKRETTYGFWGSFSVNVDWCTDDNEKETKSRIQVKFNKWIDATTVDALLF